MSSNSYNPLLNGDPEIIATRIANLMPSAPVMTAEERAAFEKKCKDGEDRYREARFGKLPEGIYRILEQGGFAGWSLELEIDGESVLLEGSSTGEGRYAVFCDMVLADKLAREEIAKRHGQDAADNAKFVKVWGGCL